MPKVSRKAKIDITGFDPKKIDSLLKNSKGILVIDFIDKDNKPRSIRFEGENCIVKGIDTRERLIALVRGDRKSIVCKNIEPLYIDKRGNATIDITGLNPEKITFIGNVKKRDLIIDITDPDGSPERARLRGRSCKIKHKKGKRIIIKCKDIEPLEFKEVVPKEELEPGKAGKTF